MMDVKLWEDEGSLDRLGGDCGEWRAAELLVLKLQPEL